MKIFDYNMLQYVYFKVLLSMYVFAYWYIVQFWANMCVHHSIEITALQVSCREHLEWIKPCTMDPPTKDDGLDEWVMMGMVRTYVHTWVSYMHTYILCIILLPQ